MLTNPRCPLCGKPAASMIMVFGARLIGCPCVGERAQMVSIGCLFEHLTLPVSRGNLLAFYNTEHDPGDEDRRPT